VGIEDLEQVANVVSDRRLGEVELLTDLLDALALREQIEYF